MLRSVGLGHKYANMNDNINASFFSYSKCFYCLEQDLLIRSYYGRAGLDYNLGRINMGGCDFSTRPYTYCDVESPNLEHFELQEEDMLYKVFTNKLINA